MFGSRRSETSFNNRISIRNAATEKPKYWWNKRFRCRRHLNRLFHQYFGFSVAALRMEMRLLKDVSLLRDPNIKVINVAEQCGFNHLGLFNTCFKRRFGQTPGHWRKTSAPARGQETGTRGLAIPPIRSRIEAGPKATLNARAIH